MYVRLAYLTTNCSNLRSLRYENRFLYMRWGKRSILERSVVSRDSGRPDIDIVGVLRLSSKFIRRHVRAISVLIGHVSHNANSAIAEVD